MRLAAITTIAGSLAILMALASPAYAEDETPPADCLLGRCKVEAESGGRGGSSTIGSDATAGPRGATKKTPKVKGKDPKVEKYNKQVAAWDKWHAEVDRNLAAFQNAMSDYSACMHTAGRDQGPKASVPCETPDEFKPGSEPDVDGFSEGGRVAEPPTLSPAQAAQIAVAQLRIPTTNVGIGPDPADNEWDMLAVGFPVWLYADGDTSIGPVTDSVGGITVSIEASIASTTYSMGDGTKVDCTGTGTRYTSAVEPGSPSPTCGHVYKKPSLPDGSYTVTSTTTWAVAWSAGGQSGVINVPSTATANLPIGELQAVVTN